MDAMQDTFGESIDSAVGIPTPNSVFDAVLAGDYQGMLRQQALVMAHALDRAGQSGRAAAAALASKELRDLLEVLAGMEASTSDDAHHESEASRAREYWQRHAPRLAIVGDAAHTEPA